MEGGKLELIIIPATVSLLIQFCGDVGMQGLVSLWICGRFAAVEPVNLINFGVFLLKHAKSCDLQIVPKARWSVERMKSWLCRGAGFIWCWKIDA